MLVRKNILTLISLSAVILFCIGCSNKKQYGKYTAEEMRQIGLANKYDLPAPTGNNMVLGIHSETISSDEILADNQVNLEQAAGQMDRATFDAEVRPYFRFKVREKITDILLYQAARKTAPDNIDDMLEKAVDAEVTRFVASYGNDYALAEKKFKELGLGTDWRSFKAYQKKMILTQSYLSSQIKSERRFSQKELRDFYEQKKDEMFCQKGEVGFSLIEIRPEMLTAEQVAEDQSKRLAAKRIADQLVKEIKAGAELGELAKQYHGDLANIGGKVLPVEPGTDALPEPYNSLESHAVKMQPNQIDGPIEVDGRIFVLRLDTLQASDCQSFEEAEPMIQRQLLNQYYMQQRMELVNKLVTSTDMAELDRFTDFCVDQAYRRWGKDS
jgi:hypothetical protein